MKDSGEQVVIDTRSALQMAKDAGLDLVEVSPTQSRPSAASSTTGSSTEQLKKNKAAKAKQHTVKLKEIKMHPKTATNDYQYRIKQAKDFLQDGMEGPPRDAVPWP